MADAKHTPAPWEISHEPPRWIIQSTSVPIGARAVAWLVGDYLECAPNARLIAAAPDLLAAAKALLVSDDIHSWDTPATIALRAAIAKAEGR